MDANLYDYSERNPPNLKLSKPVRHPTNPRNIIGHIGQDFNRDLIAATFPRKKSEHWFRGDSTSGLTGYGISEDVLDGLDRPEQDTVERIIIIEVDTNRVIEYEKSDFKDATVVAYSSDLNQSVIGKDEALRIDEDIYDDRQRVIPIDGARQVFDRSEVEIHQ